jgi:hypothetical protein
VGAFGIFFVSAPILRLAQPGAVIGLALFAGAVMNEVSRFSGKTLAF